MNAARKRRLTFVVIVGIAAVIAAFLIIKALQQNMNLYFTPTQIAAGAADHRLRIRVGGIVQKGTVIRGPGLAVTFIITDYTHQLKVYYTGILPDLFKEGQGIVALGTLNAKHEFMAQEVLAKHDENYMPPEIKHP